MNAEMAVVNSSRARRMALHRTSNGEDMLLLRLCVQEVGDGDGVVQVLLSSMVKRRGVILLMRVRGCCVRGQVGRGRMLLEGCVLGEAAERVGVRVSVAAREFVALCVDIYRSFVILHVSIVSAGVSKV